MTAVAVSAPPAPGPSRMHLADRLAPQHHGVERALDRRQRVIAAHEAGVHAGHDGRARLDRRGDQLGPVAQLGAVLDVGQVEPVDAHMIDLLQNDAGVERDRREDRDLGRGVGAGDVLGGVGLGVAEPLRLGQSVGVGGARLHHLAQDEVRGAVDDAVDAVDAAHDHRLAQHLDHRDGRAHAGLEAKLHSVLLGGAEELLAVPGQELLVGRDDRLARLEERQHMLAGRLDPAHDLGDHRDRGVVPEPCEVRGEQAGRGVGVPGRVAHEGRGDLDRAARDALDRRRAAVEEAVDRRTDCPVAEEADAGGRHWPRRYRVNR